MIYLIIGILLFAATFVFFISDGKYFGKKLFFYIYNIFGIHIFSIDTEKDIWQRLYYELDLKGNEKILDIGTATGNLPIAMGLINSFKGEITGIDWSPKMIDYAKKRAKAMKLDSKINLFVMDITKEKFSKNNFFDVIFCFGLVETYKKPELLLNKIVSLLSKNGIIVLSLYRSGVKLTEKYYKDYFIKNGFNNFRIISIRRSMDFIIIKHM